MAYVKMHENKNLKTSISVKDTIGMEFPYYYRNKAQFPVGYSKNNEIIITQENNFQPIIIEKRV